MLWGALEGLKFRRSENFFTSWQKLARNSCFLPKYINILDSDKISSLVPTVLRLSAAKSEHFDFNILKKLQMFWFVEETFAFQPIKYMSLNLETVSILFHTESML